MAPDSDLRASIDAAIRASARHLDAREFEQYLALYADDGEYRIEVRAPELRVAMVWMLMTRTELASRLTAVPRHEWQITQPLQTRLVTPDVIEVDGVGVNAVSPFVVFNTDDEGRSACYAVGRYVDRWHLAGNSWRLRSRCVQLQTRLLNPPTPIPL